MPRLKLAEPEENRNSLVCWSAELASILNTQKDANLTSLKGTKLIAVGDAHGTEERIQPTLKGSNMFDPYRSRLINATCPGGVAPGY